MATLAVAARSVAPIQLNPGVLQQLVHKKSMERCAALGIQPTLTVLMPEVMEAAAGGGQPELLSGWLATQHKDHTVAEGRIDDALSTPYVDIIRQCLEGRLHFLEGLVDLLVILIACHSCSPSVAVSAVCSTSGYSAHRELAAVSASQCTVILCLLSRSNREDPYLRLALRLLGRLRPTRALAPR